MDDHVFPAEPVHHQQRIESGDPVNATPVLESLKHTARSMGLWNLFHPDERWGAGLSNVDYAPLAEIMGRSVELAPEATNCSAPDTGNMEVLSMFGSPEQQERWLVPLLEGEIRSCFAMTEPAVASSDPRNLELSIAPDGDGYVLDGRKWWTTGALGDTCRIAIVMGVTDPAADPKRRHSMILVPMDTAGVVVERGLPVFGYHDRGGHGVVRFDGVRVPRENLIAGEGEGAAIAQARLGPGRIHHCMRAIGMAERALDLMRSRVKERHAFGSALADKGVVQEWIAESRWRIEQARLLVLKTAWLIDTAGNRAARSEISAIKVVVPRTALWVIDHAIQAHGGAGVSDDFPLARMYAMARTLRIADGPDEVHTMVVARSRAGAMHLPRTSLPEEALPHPVEQPFRAGSGEPAEHVLEMVGGKVADQQEVARVRPPRHREAGRFHHDPVRVAVDLQLDRPVGAGQPGRLVEVEHREREQPVAEVRLAHSRRIPVGVDQHVAGEVVGQLRLRGPQQHGVAGPGVAVRRSRHRRRRSW